MAFLKWKKDVCLLAFNFDEHLSWHKYIKETVASTYYMAEIQSWKKTKTLYYFQITTCRKLTYCYQESISTTLFVENM